MNGSRKKSGVALRATVVAVVALVAYPLNFGPVYWIGWPRYLSFDDIEQAYQPILWVTALSVRW